MYFNYYAKAKRLIAEGHLLKYEFLRQWGKISPALVLYFDNEKPMPIRENRWEEYLALLPPPLPCRIDKTTPLK